MLMIVRVMEKARCLLNLSPLANETEIGELSPLANETESGDSSDSSDLEDASSCSVIPRSVC